MAYSLLGTAMSDCEADVESIDMILQGLLEKKQMLQRFMSVYKPCLAADRRLPLEILREIILFSIEYSIESDAISSNMLTAMRISWVSTHVSEINYRILKLWTKTICRASSRYIYILDLVNRASNAKRQMRHNLTFPTTITYSAVDH